MEPATTTTANRIIGFDIARAYALFGMFIVNFNTVYGSHTDHNGVSGFLNLFNGNSSTLFVMLAGMGVAMMTARNSYSIIEKQTLRSTILKRSWFLFFIGLALVEWWPADILHFYGGYMHIAAFLLCVPKRWYVISALIAIACWHALLLLIPFESGWNFTTLRYDDFWTPVGFIRNTFYNGWNPIFPWIAYFFLGMWLGRLNWSDKSIKLRILVAGEIVFFAVEVLQYFSSRMEISPDLAFYVNADYLPPALPFMLGTAGFGCVLLAITMWLGDRFGGSQLAQWLATTGQMTLSHYILSLTVGMLLLSLLTGKPYTSAITTGLPTGPVYILLFSILYYAGSVLFSVTWKRKFTHGPFELLMRKVSR